MKNKGERRKNLTVASFGLEYRAEIRPSVTCPNARMANWESCLRMANWESCIRQFVEGRENTGEVHPWVQAALRTEKAHTGETGKC